MRAPALLLPLLVLLALAPLAQADHVYSHRYVVLGRVVDADGLPVENATVRVEVSGLQVESACAPFHATDTEAIPGRMRNVTDRHGEFWFCLHTHTIPAGASFRVTAAGTSVNTTADPHLRQSFVVVRLPEPSPQANATTAAESYTLLGRVWRPGATTLEGIPVHGVVVPGAALNITVLPDEGDRLRANATTNAYGDWAIRVPTAARLTSGRIVVEAFGEATESPIDPTGATYFRIVAPATNATPTTTSPTPPTPTPTGGKETGGAATPANDAPFVPLAAVLGVLVLVALRKR